MPVTDFMLTALWQTEKKRKLAIRKRERIFFRESTSWKNFSSR